MRPTRILMIGAGRMAEAVLSGILKQRHPAIEKITLTNRQDRGRLDTLKERYGVHASSNWEEEVADHDVIFLASPPSTHDEILKRLGNIIDGQLVVTVAAGIDTTFMEERLPKGTPVCWIMPNTAAQIGESISTFTCGHHVNPEHRDMIAFILEAIGESAELSEQQVHDLTAVTGSAPAFVYAFVEAMEEAAVENGVTPEQARSLVTKMLSGSAAMLAAGHSPQDLRDQVASPGGSTAAGLEVLNERKYKEAIKAAVKATNAHARGE
ncbi:pyrroline-5-carboxylate reductase [Alteribacter aurantiacus]|uniref:pyrroline-5-carboxylate reductase n=1 Tax=Alteribacter aurantiacus TaxID=254410 RepID=UPI00040D37DE|nr:pyrroline-5-carboxylate reductase [Alteribacter aurantiacus]